MPDDRVFIDTNVLLYSHDRRDPEKASKAKRWLTALATRRAAITNLQVLNECTYVLLRKKWFENPEQVFETMASFSELGDSPLTVREVYEARQLHLRYGVSWWDCLLLASATELGCTHFLSEDLQDGQRIEGLTIVDPFAHTPEDILSPR
ncbi:PIN domain-containing protein [Arvimicrobium flavum]|uniref:PIN domain-containing protein n=1 Tax=Arvimicrobium flavum TaxID=3393320 RepID=UPI00237BA1C6|nr:PIN domain-containing protein [Mesorhizobium shangrilense]